MWLLKLFLFFFDFFKSLWKLNYLITYDNHDILIEYDEDVMILDVDGSALTNLGSLSLVLLTDALGVSFVRMQFLIFLLFSHVTEKNIKYN